MTLNLVRPYKKENPGMYLTYVCADSIVRLLEPIMLEAGVDEVLPLSRYEASRYPMSKNLIGYPLMEGYPNQPMRQHLIQYFAKEIGIRDMEGIFDSFYLEKGPRPIAAPYCTIHVQAGWSMYKNWPIERWEEVCRLIKEVRPEVQIIQLGGPTDVKLQNCDQHYLGRSFVENLKLLGHARFHLGIDSWSNHATNILWNGTKRTPSVILWGSTQYQAAGYKHNRNISLGLACQPCFKEDPKISKMSRGPCTNPPEQTYEQPRHACMQDITVERVVQELIGLLNENP